MRITNEDRAHNLYEWLLAHQETPFSYVDLAYQTGMRPGSGFTQVMNRVSALAAKDGLCLRTPVFENDYTTMLTADADEVLHSMFHVSATRRGVERREKRLTKFVAENATSGSDAAEIAPLLELKMQTAAKVKEFMTEVNTSIEKTSKAIIERRRAERQKASAES